MSITFKYDFKITMCILFKVHLKYRYILKYSRNECIVLWYIST